MSVRRGSIRAFDTETVNRFGRGEACLLIRERSPGGAVEWRESPGTFAEIFDFLALESRTTYYGAWNMDFDARAIVHPRWIPFEPLIDLAVLGFARWGGFRFDFLPGKFLRIARASRDKRALEIYDLRQFYSLRLEQAAKEFLTGETKDEIPSAWYGEMDICLLDSRRERVIRYAIQDVRVLSRLLSLMQDRIAAAGLSSERLISCASVAREHFGPRLKEAKPPYWVNEKFRRAFYGGRVEVGVLGRAGPTREFDIRSAYPSVMAGLPAPVGAVIQSRGDWTERGATYGSYSVRAWIPESWRFGPLAVRRDGKIVYPVGAVRTNCARPALDLMRSLKVPFEVLDAVEIFTESDRPLLSDIPEIYERRKDPVSGPALKLVLNGVYGLTSERRAKWVLDPDGEDICGLLVRREERDGPLSNLPMASAITETVRMEIFRRAHEIGAGAAVMATDGLTVAGKLAPKLGGKLGDWSLKAEADEFVVLGCGRYFSRQGTKWKAKLRGFPLPRDREIVSDLMSCRRAFFEVPTFGAPSLRQWAEAPAPGSNVLAEIPKKLTISDNKREWAHRFTAIGDAFRFRVDSQALEFSKL